MRHVAAHVTAVGEEAVRAHLLDAHGIFFDGEPSQQTMKGVHYLTHEVDERLNSYPAPVLPRVEELPLKTRRRRTPEKKVG